MAEEKKEATPPSTVSNTTEIPVKVEKVTEETLYQKLSKPIPEELLFSYEEDDKVFTGYKAQYAIDLLNETFGIGNWYAEFKLEKVENIKGSWMAYGTVEINLHNQTNEDDVFNERIFLADGIGGSYARRLENALKGAKTSAFKNACRYLSIGKELFRAEPDDDIISKEEIIVQPEEPVLEEEGATILTKINKAANKAQLESLKSVIQSIPGKATKEALVKKYNDQMIKLEETK